MKNVKGFTLLEILMVIAIIAILGGLVIFIVRPSDLLTDSSKAKNDNDIDLVEHALEAYAAFNTDGDKYPPELQNLPTGVYDICREGINNCSGNPINIDTLIDQGFLAQIPVNAGCPAPTDSCYNVKSTNNGETLEILADSDVIVCSTGYVEVPGNSLYGTKSFCVMKYEAKNVGGYATSQAATTPWVSITQLAAINACSALGPKYHLITNNEWMTIARDLEQQTYNWTTGTIGSGEIYSGHNDSIPNVTLAASVDDNLGYTGTGNVSNSNQRRTLRLSNGNIIWDLSANAWEWLSTNITCAATTCTSAEMPFDSTPAEEVLDFNQLVTYGSLSYDLIRPSNPTWTSTKGMGRFLADVNSAYPSGNVHALLRGGTTGIGNGAGIYTMDVTNAPTHSFTTIGFRCAMSN